MKYLRALAASLLALGTVVAHIVGERRDDVIASVPPANPSVDDQDQSETESVLRERSKAVGGTATLSLPATISVNVVEA